MNLLACSLIATSIMLTDTGIAISKEIQTVNQRVEESVADEIVRSAAFHGCKYEIPMVEMLAFIETESHFRPWRKGRWGDPIRGDGGAAYGLMQVHIWRWQTMPRDLKRNVDTIFGQIEVGAFALNYWRAYGLRKNPDRLWYRHYNAGINWHNRHAVKYEQRLLKYLARWEAVLDKALAAEPEDPFNPSRLVLPPLVEEACSMYG